MKLTRVLALAGIATLVAAPAAAQTVGIGTTKGGATGQVSAGIAKVVSQHGGLQMRPQPMAGTQKYVPAVDDGSLEFGVANIMQTTWSINGTVLSEGHPNANLRMVATLMKFRIGPRRRGRFRHRFGGRFPRQAHPRPVRRGAAVQADHDRLFGQWQPQL